MARADTFTQLSLDRFAKIMGVNPLHFNGVFSSVSPVASCAAPLMQYDWQSADAVSRESIAVAIQDAEMRISTYLRFKPLPAFEVDERHSVLRPNPPELFARRAITTTGLGAALKLDYGQVVAGGIEQRTAISLNLPIVYSDADSDGYKETATLGPFATTVTDINEIALVFPGLGGAAEWEVRPITVTIVGGQCTIVARREQLVIPALLESFAGKATDGDSDPNFQPNMDVYRIWHDPSQQVQFLWESPFSSCGCGDTTCASCFLSAQFGCTIVRDYRTGLITGQPAVWNSVTSAYESTQYAVNRAPDRARFWYRAGYRNQRAKRPFVEMDPRWERAIALLAAANLERPMCGCPNVENITRYWREDLALVHSDTQGGDSYQFPRKFLDNPIGTTRGAMQAWRIIRMEAIGEAVVV